MTTTTTDNKPGSSMSTHSIEAHIAAIAVMFVDNPQPACTPPGIPKRRSRDLRVSA